MLKKTVIVNNKIEGFNKIISIPGDKSLSIRWILFSSLAKGLSRGKNLLMSEDVIAAINAIKKLGIKVKKKKMRLKFLEKELTATNIKKI